MLLACQAPRAQSSLKTLNLSPQQGDVFNPSSLQWGDGFDSLLGPQLTVGTIFKCLCGLSSQIQLSSNRHCSFAPKAFRIGEVAAVALLKWKMNV